MQMTKEQKEFINKVILPTLVEMWIEDELPSDMNQLGYHHFEKATQEFNDSPEQRKAREIRHLEQYLGEGETSMEDQYEIVKNFTGSKMTLLSDIEGLSPSVENEYMTINDLVMSL